MAFISFKYLDSTTTSLIGQRNSKNTKSTYLRGIDGIPFNISPYIIPNDCFLVSITASGTSPDPWTVYIRSNGSDIIGATATINTAYSITPMNIQLLQGQPIEIFVDTPSQIEYPNVTLTFRGNIF